MQLRKFYGRTLKGAVARVRQELGDDALILETTTLKPNSAAARMNPGALYEICAVREGSGGSNPNPSTAADANRAYKSYESHKIQHQTSQSNFLYDLGQLRAQIRDLLEPVSAESQLSNANLDLEDYQSLIDLGVDHRTLAPHFREWLDWRTASDTVRTQLASEKFASASRMRGVCLREWLWHAWSLRQALPPDALAAESAMLPLSGSTQVLSLLGGTGVGKTTTLAKISSKLRHEKRKDVAVLTLDTRRFGATEQWKRFSKLLDIPVQEIVTQADLATSMETWDRYSWIGIDTPGGLNPDSEPGRIYGHLLAQIGSMKSVLLLPTAQQEAASRDQMRWAKRMGCQSVMFSKLDETSRTGSLVNLTMDGAWKIDSLTTGRRVPQDWEPASGQLLWDRVLAPRPDSNGEGALQ